MGQTIFLRGAAQLLTLRGLNSARRGPALQDLGIIEDGSILIRDGLIFALGQTRRIENLKEARGAQEIPVYDKVVMPGFADAGLHMAYSFGDKPQRRKKTNEFLEESLATLRSCLHHGTVLADVGTKGGTSEASDVISALRQLTRVGAHPVPIMRTWLLDAPPEDSDAEALGVFDQNLAMLSKKKLIDFVELNTRNWKQSHAYALNAARDSGLGIKLRADGEYSDEFAAMLERVNPRTISLPGHIDAKFCEVLSKIPSILVLAPSQDISSVANGGCSVRELIDSGAAVALASGYDSSQAASVSMQMAISLAVIRMHLTTEEAISAATINAASALGLGERSGSLTVGKRADLLVMNVRHYQEIARQYGINHVGMVIRDGNVVFNRLRLKAGA